MLSLLHRDPFSKSEDPDDQATAYSGKSLPLGSVYYSKAGWNGAEYTLAIFTDDSSKRAEIIPFVSQRIAQEFSRTAPKADLAPGNGRTWAGYQVIKTIAGGQLVCQ